MSMVESTQSKRLDPKDVPPPPDFSLSSYAASKTEIQDSSTSGVDGLHEDSPHRRLISRKPSDANEGVLEAVESRALSQKTVWNCLKGVILAAFAIPFFVYGFTAWHLHNTPVTNKEQWLMLDDFGNKLATAFPFIFAVVIGSTIKQISAWKLEQGTTLGFLEQMMGSFSAGSTLITQLFLRRTNFIALLLIAIWSLSPLGSQSCLQLLRVGNVPVTKNVVIDYLNTDASNVFQSADDAVRIPSLNALLFASLTSPASIRNSNMDLWGNVKVPDISRLAMSEQTDGQLVKVANTTKFSSLLGIPLAGVTDQGNTSFQMETSYIAVHCYDNITTINHETSDPLADFFNVSVIAGEGITPVNGTYSSIGTGPGDPFLNASFSIAINTFYDPVYGVVTAFINDTRTYEPATILFQSIGGQIAAFCPVTTTYVKSTVQCTGKTCSVTSIQPSQIRHPNSNLTNLSFPFGFASMMTSLSAAMMLNLHTAVPTMLESFIMNPDHAVEGAATFNFQNVSMVGVSANDLGFRLQQIINTYLYGSIDTPSFAGDTVNFNSSFYAPINVTTQGTNVIWQSTYICNYAWLFALLLATTMMFIAAITSLCFSLLTRGPNILGYFSTVLRDSPYIETSLAGSTLDGIDRARKFAKTKIQLVDVEEDDQNGYIAIADMGKFQGGLVKGRYYK